VSASDAKSQILTLTAFPFWRTSACGPNQRETANSGSPARQLATDLRKRESENRKRTNPITKIARKDFQTTSMPTPR